MICTATINGIAVEIHGTAQECSAFFALRFLSERIEELDRKIEANQKRAAEFTWREENKTGGKICDPMARHICNCGADDCPLITPGACSHPLESINPRNKKGEYFCNNCSRYI